MGVDISEAVTEVLPRIRDLDATQELAPVRRIVVVVPAHDEAATIASTLAAVLGQTRAPDEVVVVADNCSDNTARIAQSMGCTVMATVDNLHKKAGALNQAVENLLPTLRDGDVIAGFDADTIPDPGFLRAALRHHDNGRGAVGAVFAGRSGGGLLGLLQRNEYARFGLDQRRRAHKVDVLSGTGWSYTARTLRRVIEARQIGWLPCAGRPQVWLTDATVEDFELTLALRQLRVSMTSPADCRVTTDIMPTLRHLYTQRLRWQRGTLDELRRYGWQRATRGLILKQIVTYATVLITPLFAAYITAQYAAHGVHGLDPTAAPVWSALGSVLVLDRIWRTRTAGRAGLFVAALVLPEYLYDVGRQVLYIRALAAHLFKSKEVWGAGHADI